MFVRTNNYSCVTVNESATLQTHTCRHTHTNTYTYKCKRTNGRQCDILFLSSNTPMQTSFCCGLGGCVVFHDRFQLNLHNAVYIVSVLMHMCVCAYEVMLTYLFALQERQCLGNSSSRELRRHCTCGCVCVCMCLLLVLYDIPS